MGTRADFYLGRGKDAKWLGSVAWDGDPSGIPDTIKLAKSQQEYMQGVEGFSVMRKDWTPPEQGWPWPWEDSKTTDYAYAFDDGVVWASNFGSPWFGAVTPPKDTDELRGKPAIFPDMSKQQRVTFGPRSGVFIIGGEPPEERLDVPGSKVKVKGRAGTKSGKNYLTKRRPIRVQSHSRKVN